MTPEEIMQAYDVLVQEGNQYAAQEAAKVGNSQRSIGGLAEVVANPSGQTSGLANYTYNRTMRPVVDSLAATLTTTGKTQAMDRYLKDELMKAKNAYENAKNNYTVAATTPKNNGGGSITKEVTEDGGLVEKQDYIEEGTYLGSGTSGDGWWDVNFADGKGGHHTKRVYADSKENAKKKVTIVGTGSSGNGVYDIILADGTIKQYFANSPEEARSKYYNDNYSW